MTNTNALSPPSRQTRSRTGTTCVPTVKATRESCVRWRRPIAVEFEVESSATMTSARRTNATIRKPASKPASRSNKSKTASRNTREDSLSRRFPGLLPNLSGSPLSSSPPPTSAPAPAPTPTPTPVPPAIAAAAVVVPSSPPHASSPVPDPLYDMEIECTLRVNRTTKVKDMAITTQRDFLI
ncbi:hypothetical protein BU23DRAFT_142362 [Bimuria novae-zelandiae CBS 107.79]|uniref:Uncharacterized protein n=1 Tax=Bimuria novae-zelandiae CBS 107.79 TaxID=1447943 RepID=A0A6A5V9T1_9PLEO|nr:hypothetical protein BU23DRAFT_142362 [Bimuria novae-zelandiae CBS 107.79]